MSADGFDGRIDDHRVMGTLQLACFASGVCLTLISTALYHPRKVLSYTAYAVRIVLLVIGIVTGPAWVVSWFIQRSYRRRRSPYNSSDDSRIPTHQQVFCFFIIGLQLKIVFEENA